MKKGTKPHFVEDATPEQRKKVLSLRESGYSFQAISREMGWRGDKHGSRPYQIVWAAVRNAKKPAAAGERYGLRPEVVKARV